MPKGGVVFRAAFCYPGIMAYLSTKRILIAVVIAALAAGVVGWYTYQAAIKPSSNQATDENGVSGPASEPGTSSPPHTAGAGETQETVAGGTFLPEGIRPSDFPQLKRPISFSAIFSAEAQLIMREKIEASISALEKDPRLFDEWMNLAILRKTVDDYEGARQIWEFLARTNPKQPGPYVNLASLYAFELKDPVRAELNFAHAIGIWPKEVVVYRNAYEFYRYVQKDDAKAKEILQKGIAETESTDLRYLLDHYADLSDS